ncbi:hypothetical protein H0H93_000524 [Arthromyces matolae]|nr:hypothetical protein H0H93_000524 [Arthromyces matolae]
MESPMVDAEQPGPAEKNPVVLNATSWLQPEEPPKYYDERAREFWALYNKESEVQDEIRIARWKATIDPTLLFASTFLSVAFTGFMANSPTFLQADTMSPSAPSPSSTTVQTTSLLKASSLVVNTLWILSLACTSLASLLSTSIPQWIGNNERRVNEHTQPEHRAYIRALLSHGCKKWRFEELIESTPFFHYASIFLSFLGLSIALWQIDRPMFAVLLAITIFFYLYLLRVATPTPLVDANLASSFKIDPESLHDEIRAISTLISRTNDDDDMELQELVETLSGILISPDGKYAWNSFLTNHDEVHSPSMLAFRTLHLLHTCSGSHLDQRHRFQRAGACINVLFAFSLHQDKRFSLDLSRSGYFPFDQLIRHDWRDNGALATKAICVATSSFEHELAVNRELKPSFRDLDQTAVDNALRELCELRQALENRPENLASELTFYPLWLKEISEKTGKTLSTLCDDGELRTLFLLLDTMRHHGPHTENSFNSSIIDEWVRVMCPSLVKWDLLPDAKGPQILYVLTLLGMLTWERDIGKRSPFPDAFVTFFVNLLKSLTHELPLKMAEDGFGCVSNLDDSITNRAQAVYEMLAQRLDRGKGTGNK